MKKTFEGTVVEKWVEFGNDAWCYYDLNSSNGDCLSDDLYEFEGKKVRIIVEVIQD